MLKKFLIASAVVVLFLGAGMLIGQEDLEKPAAQQRRKKVQQKKKRAKTTQKGIQGAEARSKAGPKAQGQRPLGNRPSGQRMNGKQMFQRWFGGMKKAYREKDMEKMGQLLRTMEQRQQQMQKGWQANKRHNKQPRQSGMHPGRGANRRRGWAKSNYRRRQRLGSYPKSRMYGGDFRDIDRNRRRGPRTRRGRQRPGRYGYYRS
ncbi:MAG: hypothetical protein ACYSSP_04370 [Planctomycetota bacterium]|jgi:hypothetical protein